VPDFLTGHGKNVCCFSTNIWIWFGKKIARCVSAVRHW